MLAFLVVVASPPAAEALTCGNVVGYLSQCVNYAQGKGPLTSACCNGVRSLNSAASTTVDRQTACNCVKKTATGISGINPSLVAGIPGKCHVNVPYPISASTDCTKVK
ncbi:non-specific lipid-transfer protein [Nitratidesulfovibrio sp. 1201_IL3209]|uniref:non-specific lipid-transfer protein n=1 Tax=Nitratidesulfovibrio sp. 1201_IL3209 TaxID=3084053 RepID=UPI002FDADE9B